MSANLPADSSTVNRHNRWLEIGFLVAVAVLTYGIFVHRFGIYLDDWVTYYILRRMSFWELLELAQGQSRAMHAVLMYLVGTDTLLTHIVIFAVHLTNMLLIRGLVRLIWPRAGVLATIVAALFAVYPGYWFRPINISLVTEASLTMALVSWVLAVYSVRCRGWRRYTAAAVSMLLIPLYVLTYELPFGIEALRPLLFWALIGAPTPGLRLRRTLLHWWPWLLTLFAVVLYRLVIFESTGFYASLDFNAVAAFDPAAVLGAFVPVFLVQIVGIWFNPQYAAAFVDLTGLMIGAVLGAAAFVLLTRSRLLKDTAPITRTLTGMLLVGLLIVVLGQATQIITMKPPGIAGWYSRWNQISMLGVALIWSSGITLIARGLPRQRAVILIAPLMVAAGSIVHVYIGNYYAEEWQDFRSLWWQVAETAPYIADDTTILLDFPDTSIEPISGFWPFPYEELAAADIFFDNPTVAAVDYRSLFDLDRDGRPGGYAIDNGNWALRWEFNPDQHIMLRLVDGCLQVIDPANLEHYNLQPRMALHLAEILTPNPQQFFVPEPAGKPYPDRDLFGAPISAEGCPSPFAIPQP